MKRAFFLILGIVVSVACFAWSLQGTEPEAVDGSLRGRELLVVADHAGTAVSVLLA
jgi:hypothetical protein